ncbi:DegT/DnrJ/EryC1/StrS family aminotransferase [Micromonospora sp. NPDC048843]|uniref:DegT/DnrJ/EryC1/StrS family aminotransferase n=1 Tax=Micromonospora sp. NPDC048843 TaxID=3155389 RepID=UPI0033F93625
MSRLALDGGLPVLSESRKLAPWPQITDSDRAEVIRALDSASPWRWPFPIVSELEEAWSRQIGTTYALACNSGTAALHMAVAACGVEAGDEVIVPADSFLSTASCVLQANAIPIFVDVDKSTYNIDPLAMANRITDRTRAVIAVDLHGLPADYEGLRKTLEGSGIALIEDGSQAHGAEYRGRQVGALGDVSACSLNGSKNLSGLGEGGLLATNDMMRRNLAAQVMMFGENESRELQGRTYDVSIIGWNYRIDLLAAAFARSQLRRLGAASSQRSANGQLLTELLSDLDVLQLPLVPPDRTHVYFFYPLLLRCEAVGLPVSASVAFRDTVQKAVSAEGLTISAWQRRPLPLQDLFQSRRGFGGGCPWTCHQTSHQVSYLATEYPAAADICSRRLVIGQSMSSLGPPNGVLEMNLIAECLHKVLVENIDRIVALTLDQLHQ